MSETFSLVGKAIKLISAFAIVCIFSFFPAGSFSTARAATDDGLIIEEYKETGVGALEQIREYVFLNFGAFATPTGPSRRNLLLGSGGFDFSKDSLQVYLEGRAYREEVRFRQTRESCASCQPEEQFNRERTLKIETDELELTEAYVGFSPVPQFNIKVGKRKVVWGQFDVVSPVFFTLPLRTQNLGTTFSKVNFGLAQNNAQVSLIPHERIELQGYFFLKTIINPLIAEYFEDFSQREEDVVNVRRKDLQDHNQYAARVLFYPNWGTIAFTYYNGRNSLFPNRLETVGSGADSFRGSPDLSKLEAYSIEASVPRGRWNFKGELSYRESQADLERVDDSNNLLPITDPGGDTPEMNYRRWAVERNGGRLYGDIQTLFGGIGVEYTAERWKVEVAGYFINENFTGEAETGADLVNAYQDDPNTGLLAAPFINAAYFITQDKQNFVALTAGFLGSFAAGASVYAVTNIDRFDHLGAGTLQLIAGLDFLQYFSDSELSQLREDDEGGNWEFDDGFVVAPRVGLIWKF